jgi:hypothetical protein
MAGNTPLPYTFKNSLCRLYLTRCNKFRYYKFTSFLFLDSESKLFIPFQRYGSTVGILAIPVNSPHAITSNSVDSEKIIIIAGFTPLHGQ